MSAGRDHRQGGEEASLTMMPAAARVEVFTGRGRRRRWSAALKAQIVEDSYLTSVGEAASRYDVSKTQILLGAGPRRMVSVR